MIDFNISKYEMMCSLLEVNYNKKMGIDSDEKRQNYYPADWYLNHDYEFKSHVLAEAIQKDISIIDTELYNTRIEGVQTSK